MDPSTPDEPDTATQMEASDALFLACGHGPEDVDVQLAVVEGDTAHALVSLASRADDVLVMAAGTTVQDRVRGRPSVRRLLRCWRRRGWGELLVTTGPYAIQRWEAPSSH